MNCRVLFASLTLLLAGCAGLEYAARLDVEAGAVKERIAQAREERDSFGKGSVIYDLITLRIAMNEQALAMLEQRRAAGAARVQLTYSVDGKPYVAPEDAAASVKRLESKLQELQAGRERDLQLIKESGDTFGPLYAMTAAVKAIQMSQIDYQLTAYRMGFPPYYVPFSPLPESTTPQVIEVPAGRSIFIP